MGKKCCKCSKKGYSWIAFSLPLGRHDGILRGHITSTDFEIRGHRAFEVLSDEFFSGIYLPKT